MYKLVGSLLVVYIVVALYSLTFNVDISMYSLLQNLGNAEWREFPTDRIQGIVKDFKDIGFSEITWKDIFTTWKLFKKLSNVIINGFSIFTGVIKLLQELFSFIFLNIAEFFKVMFKFLKPNMAN